MPQQITNRIISDSEFRKQLKSNPACAYLFFGEEDYLKCSYARLAEQTISPNPTYSFFNNMKIDASDYTPDKLADAIMPLPMMSDRKIITLTGFDFGAMKKNEIENLCETLSLLRDYDYNTVIINVASENIDAGTPKKPSAIIQKLSAFLVPVCFETYSGPKLEQWAARHFASCGVAISGKTLKYFISYCGTNMFRLVGETEKLGAYVLCGGRTDVTEEDIRFVCIAGPEYDSYAFANAILEGRDRDAIAILGYMKFRRTDPLIISGEVSRIFCDLLMIKRLADDGMSASDIASEKYMNIYKAGIYIRTSSNLPYERIYRKILLCDEADRQLKLSPLGYSALEKLICTG